MSQFEPVPSSLIGAVRMVLYSLRNHPMSEDRVREQLNELHLLREAISRIDPEHSQAKSLPSPFFPLCAYKEIPLPYPCHFAQLRYLETPQKSSIDEVLPDPSTPSQPPGNAELFYRVPLEEIMSRTSKNCCTRGFISYAVCHVPVVCGGRPSPP